MISKSTHMIRIRSTVDKDTSGGSADKSCRLGIGEAQN